MGYRILTLLVVLGLAACRPDAETTPQPRAATSTPTVASPAAPLPTNTPLPVISSTHTPQLSQAEATPTTQGHVHATPIAEAYPNSSSSVPPQSQANLPLNGYIGFRNNLGTADQFVFSLSKAPAPPVGQAYRGWLISDDGAIIDIGPLTINPDGSATLVWNSPNSENLLSRYVRVEITLEPASGSSGAIGKAVWVGGLEGQKLTKARRMFVKNDGSPATPLNTAFALGLVTQTDMAVQHIENAVNAAAIGAQPEMRAHLEHVINILEGGAGPRYGDHDGLFGTQNPGDGFGAIAYAQQLTELFKDQSAVTAAHKDFQAQVTAIEDKTLEILKLADITAAKPQLAALKQLGDQLKTGPMTNLYRAAQETVGFEVRPVE